MTETRREKAKPMGVKHSPEELAKALAMELAVNPSRESPRTPRIRLVPTARVLLAGLVIVGVLIPAIQGAGWVESAFGQGRAISGGTSTTTDDEVLSVLVRGPEVDERIDSSPLIDSMSGSQSPGLGAPGLSGGQTPGSATPDSPVVVTTSTIFASTSTSVVSPTTVTTEPASTTTSTTSATTSTTVPTTTTTCRGNSGGNGKGNNC